MSDFGCIVSYACKCTRVCIIWSMCRCVWDYYLEGDSFTSALLYWDIWGGFK